MVQIYSNLSNKHVVIIQLDGYTQAFTQEYFALAYSNTIENYSKLEG